MTINLDHVTEQIQVTDAAADASLTVQPKGAGAFNIAAGSSGVNISNGGTVTALTVTGSGGGGYTTLPSVAISAPTTAGGVQATASINANLASPNPTIVAGGTGYTVGDVLTIVGGTFSAVGQLTVATVSAGAVTSVTISAYGTYTVLPTNPVSVTGGTGSSATFNVNWGVRSLNITNAGSGYVEQPTVTFSGGGGSGAAAYAVVGSTTTVRALGGLLNFATPGGIAFSVQDTSRTTVDYWQAVGSSGTVGLTVAGATANNNGLISSKGTGFIGFVTNNFGVEQFRVSHTASAVNYVQVTGGATGNSATLSAQGSDPYVSLVLQAKSNYIAFLTRSGATNSFRIIDSVSTTNWVQVAGTATGVAPILSAQGSDTNIPLVLQPKGTGALQAQQTDSTATGGNARGANAVDWQTARDVAGRVASGSLTAIGGGYGNTASGIQGAISGGTLNVISGTYNFVGAGYGNIATLVSSSVVGGTLNTASGFYNFIGGGFTNSGTATAVVTTQSATMNGTTTVTLSGSNASIKVGQLIGGTYINANLTYVAAISGTTLTLSTAATGSGTATLSFYTPHGVVVGGGNNQATGSYSFIGGGGDAGTAANRNVASGDWSVVGGGAKNVASGPASVIAGGGFLGTSIFGNTASADTTFVGGGILNVASNSGAVIAGGWQNISNGILSTVGGGRYATARGISGVNVFSTTAPIADNWGVSQSSLLIIGRQTTDATATRLTSDTAAASTTNQVILPNNSAYFFKGEVVAGVTGGGNTKGWTIEGVIKRGANAASTAIVGTATVTSSYADAGASTWAIAITADTTNGGLAVTFTGQAGTTIRTVAQISTTEMTF
jgi:hypothetical protein